MGFMIQCDNKGCREHQEAVLDKETNKVYCSICNGEIENITIFAKRQMLFTGQIKRDEQKKQAFAVQCQACKKTLCPKIEVGEDKTRKLMCAGCGEELSHLSAPYKQTILSFIK